MPAGSDENSKKDWAIDLALRSVFLATRWLPYPKRIAAGGWFARRIAGPLANWETRALENLNLIWPDMDQAEKRRIARHTIDNVGRSFFENYERHEFTDRMGQEPLRGAGVEPMLEALRTGKTVVFATAHFGNYEAPRMALCARGFEVGLIYRRANNAYFDRHYSRSKKRSIGPTFAKGPDQTKKFFEYLAAGNSGVIAFDVAVLEAKRLPFLGQPARTADTAARAAIDNEALLIPIYATRREDGIRFDLEFETPIAHGTPKEMTLALNQSLEKRVKADPGQWLWTHRRWK